MIPLFAPRAHDGGRSEFGKLYNSDKKFRKTLCNLPIAIYP